MKYLSIIVLSLLLAACASPKTEAEYKAAGYCKRNNSWYPAATIIDLRANKKIICVDNYWEPVSI